MEIISEWNGFKRLDFDFKGRKGTLIFPKTPLKDKKWLYKTEYLDAFPGFEIEMLKRGYYVAHLENKCRWCPQSDTDMRPIFCDYLKKEYSLSEKCFLIGMSCGGMQAVNFAAEYPQYVAAMYLDSPVMNLLSCPYALGKAKVNMIEEFEQNMGVTLSELINYREHPIDKKEKLLKTGIPIFLICGDMDFTVPYDENGKVLYDYFKENGGNIRQIVKSGCDHHPHGLEDYTPLIDFITKYY